MGAASLSCGSGGDSAFCQLGNRETPQKHNRKHSQKKGFYGLDSPIRSHQDLFWHPNKHVFSSNIHLYRSNGFFLVYSLFYFLLFLLVFPSRAILCAFKLMFSLISSARSFSTGWTVCTILTGKKTF